MKKALLLVSVGSLFTLGAIAETLSGTISDAACGAKHTGGSAKDATCVEACVKRGEAPVVVSGGKIYKITDDSKDKVMPLLGQKVTVNGKVAGDTIEIASVEPSK